MQHLDEKVVLMLLHMMTTMSAVAGADTDLDTRDMRDMIMMRRRKRRRREAASVGMSCASWHSFLSAWHKVEILLRLPQLSRTQ